MTENEKQLTELLNIKRNFSMSLGRKLEVVHAVQEGVSAVRPGEIIRNHVGSQVLVRRRSASHSNIT